MGKLSRLVARRTTICLAISFALCQPSTALDRQPSADYHARREKLAAKLDGGVALLFAPPEAEGPNDIYGYRPDNNFYYLTGWAEPGAALFVASPHEAKDNTSARPYTEILFLPQRNYSQEKWTGPKLGPDDPKGAQLTGVDRVAALDTLRDELVKLLPARGARVYTDVPAEGVTSNSVEAMSWLKNANAFPVGTEYPDIRPLLASFRTVKDAGRIELVRKARNTSLTR